MPYTLRNIEEYKKKLARYDVSTFTNVDESYLHFLNRIKVNAFRHIHDLDMSFESPVTIISGGNRVGKTSVLLLIACSFDSFKHIDPTTPDTLFRKFTWKDVIRFTSDETDSGGYSYELFWRLGSGAEKHGEGKRGVGKQSWTGLGKLSHTGRMNAKIMNREVRFIDLDRMHPARGCSKRLNYKASHAAKIQLNEEIVNYYKYIFRIPNDIKIYQTGSHINKRVFLIEYPHDGVREAYSSYNDASGEEALLNMLIDMTEAGDNALILIDELECGIHPETQRRLANIIQYLSWTKKQQYIITTHSATLLSAFPQISRKLIEINNDGDFEVISKPAVDTVFSKLDSVAHPLIKLYCEDDIALYCVKKMLVAINREHPSFDRIVNIIISGPACDVKGDYERHKILYKQMVPKQGYCCVLDGDMKDKPEYSGYIGNVDEFVEFLYSDKAPEKFLCDAYLAVNPNEDLQSFIELEDHHRLFAEMVRLGLAADRHDALITCWNCFEGTAGHESMFTDFKTFIFRVVHHFSQVSD